MSAKNIYRQKQSDRSDTVTFRPVSLKRNKRNQSEHGSQRRPFQGLDLWHRIEKSLEPVVGDADIAV